MEDPIMHILSGGVLPNDNDTETGTGADISKEVNHDGEERPNQDEIRVVADEDAAIADDPFAATGTMSLSYPKLNRSVPSMDVSQVITSKAEGFDQNMPRCPVFCTPCEDGGRYFTAYVSGPIDDVDIYVDLIDTLLIATENDCYDIFIDSPGGMIASGSFIASAIHHSKAKVRTISRGLCASAGALIHSAAPKDQAIARPTSLHMYHMSSHYDGGTSTMIAARAEQQVRYVNECLLNQALEQGHITQEEFDRIQSGDEIFVSGTRFLSHRDGANQENNGEQGSTTEGIETIVTGMESFETSRPKAKSFEPTYPFFMSQEEMVNLCGDPHKPGGDNNALLIRTADNKNYRIYMKAWYDFNATYVTRLCRFLDSRKKGETVTFVLGTRMDDVWSASRCGPIIDAISTCEAKVITIAAGWCSVGESFVWMFGHERLMFRYGGLSLNVTEAIKWCEEFKYYYQLMLNRAVELKLIDQSDIDNIWKTKIDKQILFTDFVKMFPDAHA